MTLSWCRNCSQTLPITTHDTGMKQIWYVGYYCCLNVFFSFSCSWSYSWTGQEEREVGNERWIKEQKEHWLWRVALILSTLGLLFFSPSLAPHLPLHPPLYPPLFFYCFERIQVIHLKWAGTQAHFHFPPSLSVPLSFPFLLLLSTLLGPFNPPLPSLPLAFLSPLFHGPDLLRNESPNHKPPHLRG